MNVTNLPFSLALLAGWLAQWLVRSCVPFRNVQREWENKWQTTKSAKSYSLARSFVRYFAGSQTPGPPKWRRRIETQNNLIITYWSSKRNELNLGTEKPAENWTLTSYSKWTRTRMRERMNECSEVWLKVGREEKRERYIENACLSSNTRARVLKQMSVTNKCVYIHIYICKPNQTKPKGNGVFETKYTMKMYLYFQKIARTIYKWVCTYHTNTLTKLSSWNNIMIKEI